MLFKRNPWIMSLSFLLLSILVLYMVAGCSSGQASDPTDGDLDRSGSDGDFSISGEIDNEGNDSEEDIEHVSADGDKPDGDTDFDADKDIIDQTENMDNDHKNDTDQDADIDQDIEVEQELHPCGDGFCHIDHNCIEDDKSNPDHACQVCDSSADGFAWTLRGDDHVCRDPAGVCDVAELCDGLSDDCPDDSYAEDGSVCYQDDQCLDGSCLDCIDADGCDDYQIDDNDCTDLACSAHTCTEINNNANSCSDDDPCTHTDACLDGSCSGVTYSCNDHGTCNVDDDVCTCETGYTGDYCAECTDGYEDYPNCVPGVIPVLVEIPAGEFWMGSPEDTTCPDGYPGVCEKERGNASNEQLHKVTLTTALEFGKYELKQREFEVLMGYNPSHFSSVGDGEDCGVDCPVESVSWHEVAVYANALSSHAGYEECFSCVGIAPDFSCSLKHAFSAPKNCEGFRMATEAEWEYAARAGTNTAFYSGVIAEWDTVYPDPNLDIIAWYTYNSVTNPQPAGLKQPNDWGLYDMSGNIAEWTLDWYTFGGYENGHTEQADPTGPSSGTFRMRRGGSFTSSEPYCRSASRSYKPPAQRSIRLGTRICRSKHAPAKQD